MADIAQLRTRLEQTSRIENDSDRRLWALSVVTEALRDANIRPVLVGGAAVAFYTLGGYSTSDMDVIMPLVGQVDEVMQALDFHKEGRFWVRPDLDIFLETPPPPLAGDPQRVVEVDVDGLPVYIIGVEDLIIDRLNAYVHWRSKEDGRWARRLVSAHRGELDADYLRSRAAQEDVASALDEVLSEADE